MWGIELAPLVGGLVGIGSHAELYPPGELPECWCAAQLAMDSVRPLGRLSVVATAAALRVESTLEAVTAGLADEVISGQIVSLI